MAHQIEGNHTFQTKTPAWHKLGTLFETAPTIEQARAIAYPWDLVEVPDFASIDGINFIPIPERKHIFRSDGKCIGNVGATYKLQQPAESCQRFQVYLDTGLIELEAGGSLCGGSRFWLLGKVKAGFAEVVSGDMIKSYLLFVDSFDGSLCQLTKMVHTRVVCANTEAQARNEESKLCYSLRHSKNLALRADEAQKEILGHLNNFKLSIESYRVLAAKKATMAQLEKYITSVFVPAETKAEDISTRLQNKVNHVIDLLDTEELATVKGTYWHGYNAVSKYLTHEHGRTDDSRLTGQWLGDSAEVNSKALELALAA